MASAQCGVTKTVAATRTRRWDLKVRVWRGTSCPFARSAKAQDSKRAAGAKHDREANAATPEGHGQSFRGTGRARVSPQSRNFAPGKCRPRVNGSYPHWASATQESAPRCGK